MKSNSGTIGRVTINWMYCLGSKLIFSSAIFKEYAESCLSMFLFPLYNWPRPETKTLVLWCCRLGHRAYFSARKWWAVSFLGTGDVLCYTATKSIFWFNKCLPVFWCEVKQSGFHHCGVEEKCFQSGIQLLALNSAGDGAVSCCFLIETGAWIFDLKQK